MPQAIAAALLALSLALGPMAVADDDSVALPEALVGQPIRSLTLQEALSIAIQNNLGIRIQSERLVISKTALAASEGSFEPTVQMQVNHDDSISPPANSVDGMLGQTFQSQNQRWSASLNQRLTTGTSLGLNFFSSRNKNNSGSAVEPLFYGSNLALSISQPLLQGFSLDRDIPRASILKAQFATKRDLEAKRIVISNQVLATENAYWNLAEATRSYAVQKASLVLAREQLILTERQITAGILAPADRISSESSVAQRELSLVRSEARLAGSMDALRQALNLPKEKWNEVLIASDAPTIAGRTPTFEAAMESALRQRPEIRQYALDDKSADIDKRVAQNGRLPKLDVGFNYGLAGQSNVYSGSLDQLQGLGARNWGVFANLTWAPLGRAAKANEASVRSSNIIRKLGQEQFLNDLRSEIRSAIRDLATAERQVAASERFRSLSERSLDAERKRFLNGKSRNIEVSRREEELAQAQTAEISARIDFLKAQSALDLATGSLLDQKNIKLGTGTRAGKVVIP